MINPTYTYQKVQGERYRFFISFDGGTFYQTIKLVAPIKITGKIEETSYRYSRKSSEWKFVKWENTAIYTTLLASINAPSSLSADIILKCELWDNFKKVTEIEFIGYVPIEGIKINKDTGVITLTPQEKSDYAWWDQHKNDKHDIYNEVGGFSKELKYYCNSVEEEYFIPFGGNYTAPSGFLSELSNVGQWSSTTSYIGGYYSNSWCRYGVHLWHCVYDNTNSLPSLSNDNWEVIPNEPHGYVNIVYRTYRQLTDLPFTYNGHSYIHGDGKYEEGFPAVTVPDTGASNCSITRWYYPTDDNEAGYMTPAGSLETGENHGLMDALNHMLTGSGLTISSSFFTSATDPLTGSASKTNNLRLVHSEVIFGIQDSATKGEITLDQLVKDLCYTFNCSWAIVGTTLYIEHIEFFENGFQYSGSPGIYTDLTDTTTYPLKYQVVFDKDGTDSDNEFSFSISDCKEKETFHFIEGYDYDGQLKYDSKFTQKGEENKHEISTFITDFAYLLMDRLSTDYDGWVLISASSAGIINRRLTGLRWSQGNAVITNPFRRTENTNANLLYPNGDLMWNNLLNDFWDYRTLFKTGAINGKYPSVTFNTFKRIYKQRKIRFPRLVAGGFDPYKLITTNAGNGRVETFEINTDTDFIEVELVYEES
jgi:hypothetical protein